MLKYLKIRLCGSSYDEGQGKKGMYRHCCQYLSRYFGSIDLKSYNRIRKEVHN